jgi:uncharacterized membrane protein YphA (DoxX/SURF4 family)
MSSTRLGDLILRAGLAFAFLYPPIDAIVDPATWVGYFPHFMQGLLPEPVLLHGFGLVEVVIALWILSGRRIVWPCLMAAALLVAIVVTHQHSFDVLFRDLSLAALAVGLALMHTSPAGAHTEAETA